MNFRTSYFAGMFASVLAISAVSAAFDANAAQQLRITGPDGQERVASSQKYGPTTPQDTFWSIAQKVRPDSSVSIYQVMAAIYEANPHAFSGPNYNALEKRMMLTIPSKSVMAAIPRNLAQQQAEEHDRAWRRGTLSAKPVSVRPVAKVQTAAIAKPPKVVDKPAPAVAPVNVAAPKQADELVKLQAEVTRLNDALGVKSNDVQALTTKVKELTDELQSTNEAMAELKLQNEQLLAESKELKQSQALAEVEADKPTDTWRSFMDNPLLLTVAAIIPASLILLVVWLVMRRRRHQQVAAQDSAAKTVAAAAATAAVTGAAMSAESDEIHEAAVHLDADDDDSLDSLLNMDSIELQPEHIGDEQDLFVTHDGIADDGQSLDDLWAEAMGEQAESEPESKDDDLDALMAGLSTGDDEPQQAQLSSAEDDLDALMAGLSTNDDQPDELVTPAPLSAKIGSSDVDDAEDTSDIDALMAGFGKEDESASAELTKELEDALRSNAPEADISDADLDAMLASLGTDPDNEPKVDALSVEESSIETDAAADASMLAGSDDLSDAIAAELDSELNNEVDDTDLDALLASFDAPAQSDNAESVLTSEPITALESFSASNDDDLSDEIAAELESSLSDSSLNDDSSDDLDALLAEFNIEDVKADDPSFDNDTIDFSAALAAQMDDVALDSTVLDAAPDAAPEVELANELSANAQSSELAAAIEPRATTADNEIDDLDALLASFNEPQASAFDEAADDLTLDIAHGLGNELPHSADDDSLESLLAGFEPSKDDADELAASMAGAALAGAVAGGALALDGAQKPVPRDPVAVSAKDSGFFNDLKANKSPNVLEWESINVGKNDDIDPVASVVKADTASAAPALSDEALQAEFGSDDEFMLDVGKDHSMTVDEALAALDASEKNKRSSRAMMPGDLSSFQKENGFIDIDKLLNDADNGEPEPYRELDMDIGAVESLIGNTAMVDVDDEENSVNAKLDLARAYIEIDDEDSARALLKEVEMDGNDRQKSEAATLLKEIG